MSLANKTVLITRPARFVEYLASELSASGAVPIVFPTIAIEYTADNNKIGTLLDNLNNNSLVIFTSRNAVDSVAACLIRYRYGWPKKLRCAAVGPNTAAAVLDAFGSSDVIAPASQYSFKALLAESELQDLSEVTVVLLDGGGERSHQQIQKLKEHGCETVIHHIVYKRVLPNIDVQPVKNRMDQGPVDFVVLTSVVGAQNLFKLLGAEYSYKLKVSCMIVYSERIKQYLIKMGYERVVVSKMPADSSVLEAMRNA